MNERRLNIASHYKFKEALFLLLMTLFCFALSLYRVHFTETKTYLFLNWNLFLAFVPWALTSLITIMPRLRRNFLVISLMLGSWLLFFPNAPYILTDLFHLRLNTSMPKWYDLVLILSFAWTGLLYGFFSLWDIERVLSKRLNSTLVTLCSLTLLFVASFGVYIGRYLRWNSWDIVSQPQALLIDVVDRFIDPMAHPRTWGLTLALGMFLAMVYFSLHLIKSRAHQKIST